MFNMNEFKQKTKEWLKDNPESSKKEFLAYCENLLPSGEASRYSWLLEQVSLWFENITFNREKFRRSKSRDLAS